jgi:hypothetical protein
MVSIFAITKLAIMQCFKTCFAWVLLALSILFIGGLIGRGSDTEMIRQIALCWLPFGILIIFGIGVLWMGCSSMASDIEEKRFIGTAVAPVRKSTVWIGRWIGLMISTAILLGIIFFVIGISASFVVGNERPRERLSILPESREQTIKELYEEMLSDASVDAGKELVLSQKDKEYAIAELRSQLDWQYFQLKPGLTRTWDFSLVSFNLSSDEDVLIRLSFLSSIGTIGGADGVLKIYGITMQGDSTAEPVAEYNVSSELRGNVFFSLPADALKGMKAMRVVFENAVERNDGASVFIGYGESLQVFAPSGGYWQNLLAAYFMCLGLLSIMAAMGITSGMQYSFPVAIFSSLVVMLMFVIASGNAINECVDTGTCGHNHGEEKPALFSELVREGAQGVSRAVRYTTASFINEEPLAKLGSNRLIAKKKVIEWTVVSFVILPLILCGIGSWVLSKKEFK